MESVLFKFRNSSLHLFLNLNVCISSGGCNGVKGFRVIFNPVVGPPLFFEVLDIKPLIC